MYLNLLKSVQFTNTINFEFQTIKQKASKCTQYFDRIPKLARPISISTG